MVKIQNFQNLKRLLILHRLGTIVEHGEIISEVYEMLQPATSVLVKDSGDNDIICHIDKEGKIVYFTHDSRGNKLRTFVVSRDYGKLIIRKFKKVVVYDFENVFKHSDFLRDVLNGYGIRYDLFYKTMYSVEEYLQKKCDAGNFKLLNI